MTLSPNTAAQVFLPEPAPTSPSVKPDGAFIRARLSSFKSIKKLMRLGMCKAASVSSTLPPAWLMPVQGWTAPVLGGATYHRLMAAQLFEAKPHD